MTDEELLSWWSDLGQLVIELRAKHHSDTADRLLDAVAAGATSSEILGSVGLILLRSGNLRSILTPRNRMAWDAVMADINHAYPPNFRFNHWLGQIDRRVHWPNVHSRGLIVLASTGLLLVVILLVWVFL